MKPKTKIAPCQFCQKQFKRKEHLLRHERTHTKEKPFRCYCGKAFSRSDLLSRHAKLDHDASSFENTTPNPQASSTGQTVPYGGRLSKGHEQRNNSIPSNFAYVFSNSPSAAAQVEGVSPSAAVDYINPIENPRNVVLSTDRHLETSQARAAPFYNRSLDPANNAMPMNMSFAEGSANVIGDLGLTDLDLLWSDIDMSSNLMFPTSFATDYPMNMLSMAQYGFDEMRIDPEYHSPHQSETPHESGVLSRYASRLPSLHSQPEHNDPPYISSGVGLSIPTRETPSNQLPWHISRLDYCLLAASIEKITSILPPDFVFPSRHAICRYVEGYFSGFQEHLPFLHQPTFSVVSATPELVLAITAAGARYRFQRAQSHKLYSAARSMVRHQIRQRDGYELANRPLQTPSLGSDNRTTSQSPGSAQEVFSRAESSAHEASSASNEKAQRMQTMQAMIILIALGTWNHRSLIKDALSMASQLALIVREEGLVEDDRSFENTWSAWIQSEGRRRTKLVSYAFLNLHSIAYDLPPKLTTSEICLLHLPAPESQWRASSAEVWASIRNKESISDISVKESYASLFELHQKRPRAFTFSSFGNYILIHCVIQQIYFARQFSDYGLLKTASLPNETIQKLESALRVWQRNWEATKDSSMDPSSPSGPLSFNSTALFRIAYIRLHTDLSFRRQLESRNPERIAKAFFQAPLFERSSHVCQAALQSAHSLSIPVRIGVEFVARTQTLTWSIVHSLSNLECAFFLSKWLESMVKVPWSEVREDERKLLGIVRSILNETDFGEVIQSHEEYDPKDIRHMAVAVVRLWVETFKGAHVFDIMGSIGAALERYAEILDGELIDDGSEI